jgi:hypothetical protein
MPRHYTIKSIMSEKLAPVKRKVRILEMRSAQAKLRITAVGWLWGEGVRKLTWVQCDRPGFGSTCTLY